MQKHLCPDWIEQPIFIVDDEKGVRDALKGVLSDEGFSVIGNKDSNEFFKRLGKVEPCLVLLDVWLPGVDGIAILKEFKASYPNIPVLVMSGHAGIDTAVRAIKLGADDFLEKPLHLDVLLDKIEKVLLKDQSRAGTNTSKASKVTKSPARGEKPAEIITSTEQQTTIKRDVVLNGTGLLSGQNTGIILSPLEANEGVVFQTLSGQKIKCHVTNLPNYGAHDDPGAFVANSTVLSQRNQKVRTVEHLLGAICMSGLNNVLIKVDGEIPNIDGSGVDFYSIIKEAGLKTQRHKVKKIQINEEFRIGNEDPNEKHIIVEPHSHFVVKVRIAFPDPIGEQVFEFDPETQDFAKEIAPARSFNTFENIDLAQRKGVAGSGYLNSHIIIHGGKVINTDLRFDDEFVRHKILDLIGDFFLLGHQIKGKVTANMPSHTLNQMMAIKIYESL